MTTTDTIKLIPGARYFAGYDKPFFISQSMIEDHIKGLGGQGVQFMDRSVLGSITPALSPRTDPKYGDDWDEIVTFVYAGPAQTIQKKRHWQWAIRRGPALASKPKLPNSQTPNSQTPSAPRPTDIAQSSPPNQPTADAPGSVSSSAASLRPALFAMGGAVLGHHGAKMLPRALRQRPRAVAIAGALVGYFIGRTGS